MYASTSTPAGAFTANRVQTLPFTQDLSHASKEREREREREREEREIERERDREKREREKREKRKYVCYESKRKLLYFLHGVQ